MLVENHLRNTIFEINPIVKYFFTGLTIIFTFPIILGLMIIILACIERNTSHIIVAIIGVTFVSLWCIAFGQMTLKIATNTLEIHNNKLIITHYSYLNKNHIEIIFDKIDEITVSQNILSKILNCGTISIQTISGSKNSIIDINAPYNIKSGIQHYT